MQSLSAKTSPGMKPIDVVTTPTDEPADVRRHDVWDDGSEEEEQL
jgi:hypothetical protein